MCGIFGYAGTPEHPVDLDKIKVLGTLNDTRGGNGCGLLLDTTVMKTVTPPKFGDWVKNQRFEIPKKNHVVLGHCRKASVGGVSAENSHPFQVQNEAGKNILIGMHNGTVTNWKELCAEAGVEDHNDFQVDSVGLLTLLAYSKKGDYSILSRYVGAAALAWVYNSDPNSLFLFHGSSKRYKSSGTDVEERPLYYWDTSWQLNKDGTTSPSGRHGVYFSSIKDSLEMIGALEKEVVELPFNAVFKVKGGVMTKIADVNRSAAYQDEWTYNGDTNNYSYNRQSSYQAPASQYNTPTKTGTIPNPSLFLANMGSNDLQQNIFTDTLDSKDHYGKVYFSRGLYYRGDYPVHSRIAVFKFPRVDSGYQMVDVPFYLEPDGTALLYSDGEAKGLTPRYFYRGILCKDFDSYTALTKEVEEGTVKGKAMYRQDYVKYAHPQMFVVYADLASSMTKTTPAIFNDPSITDGVSKYSAECIGEFRPLFSRKTYLFERGLLREVTINAEWNEESVEEVHSEPSTGVTSTETEKKVDELLNTLNIQEKAFGDSIEDFIAETETAINDFISDQEAYLTATPDDPITIKLILLKKIVESLSEEISITTD